MIRLSAPIKASMKKTATALILACSLLSVTSISQTQAADNIDVSFQTILQQERSWAGLQSKKLKVGDIAPNWSLKTESGKFEFLKNWTVKKTDNFVNLLFSLIGMWFYLFFLQHGVLHV